MKISIVLLFSLISAMLRAQFPGPAGTAGSTALPKDTSLFTAWGKACSISRGYQDISNTSLGYASVGDSSKAIGKADADVVSLGDGGIAVITFTTPIKNGSGFDFAVFENGFNDTFLELAFVEVSSDGVNYFRFPATSNSPASPQYTNGAVMDASKLNNLAGKYRVNYGTPFDLQEMTGIPLLDVNNVTHVKIIDAVGSVNPSYGTYDKNNNIINDPWPTPFASSGFDLDAVGVINEAVGINELENVMKLSIYPNPVDKEFVVQIPVAIGREFGDDREISVTDILGKEVSKDHLNGSSQNFDVSYLTPGIYIIQLKTKKGNYSARLTKN
jgi:hypothetical protein